MENNSMLPGFKIGFFLCFCSILLNAQSPFVVLLISLLYLFLGIKNGSCYFTNEIVRYSFFESTEIALSKIAYDDMGILFVFTIFGLLTGLDLDLNFIMSYSYLVMGFFGIYLGIFATKS